MLAWTEPPCWRTLPSMRPVSRLLRGSLLISGAVAVWAMESGVSWAAATFKPLTTILLFGVLGKGNTPLRRKVAVGLAFSLLGDVALLGRRGVWFQLGLGAFFVTHVCYISAFAPYGLRQWRSVPVAIIGVLASVGTVVLAYSEAAKAKLVVPIVVYAVVITGTLVATSDTIGGRLRHAKCAALGAALFYVADICIAINVFVPWLKLPVPTLFTTGLYWVGQYGILLAARSGTREAS